MYFNDPFEDPKQSLFQNKNLPNYGLNKKGPFKEYWYSRPTKRKKIYRFTTSPYYEQFFEPDYEEELPEYEESTYEEPKSYSFPPNFFENLKGRLKTALTEEETSPPYSPRSPLYKKKGVRKTYSALEKFTPPRKVTLKFREPTYLIPKPPPYIPKQKKEYKAIKLKTREPYQQLIPTITPKEKFYFPTPKFKSPVLKQSFRKFESPKITPQPTKQFHEKIVSPIIEKTIEKFTSPLAKKLIQHQKSPPKKLIKAPETSTISFKKGASLPKKKESPISGYQRIKSYTQTPSITKGVGGMTPTAASFYRAKLRERTISGKFKKQPKQSYIPESPEEEIKESKYKPSQFDF